MASRRLSRTLPCRTVFASWVLPNRRMLMADINIPDHAIVSARFITASGPGGQNVNKVATAAQLHVNIFALGLPPLVYSRLRALAGSRINQDGELVIQARSHRTQEANRREARERLAALLPATADPPPPRPHTPPHTV